MSHQKPFYEVTNKDVMNELKYIRKVSERSQYFSLAALSLSFAILGFLIQHINK